MSAASGFVWAVIGLVVGGVLLSGPGATLQKVTFPWAGGIIAGPLIGLFMGQVSRLFGYIEEVGLRIIIAGASLYAAAVLFVMASLLLQAIVAGHLPREVWATAFGAAAFGFEATCVVLWPLAYMNHRLIFRMWERYDHIARSH